MTDIKISDYAAYYKGNLGDINCENFYRLYGGARVRVESIEPISGEITDDEIRHLFISIRKPGGEKFIFKTNKFEMRTISFIDSTFSIDCCFIDDKGVETHQGGELDSCVYGDLKVNLPVFLRECGWRFGEDNGVLYF